MWCRSDSVKCNWRRGNSGRHVFGFDRRMIVEVCGPSGVGKTTLSHALAKLMREHGYSVELVSSARPSELFGAGRPNSRWGRFRAQLSRPAKAVGAVTACLPWSNESPVERELMSMLMDQSISTRVRNRRYLLSMGKSWADARSSSRITIFDQGYLSALCSVVCRNSALRPRMPSVLARLPKPDILILVDAPEPTIEARLRDRLGKLGRIERMLELDISTTLRQVAIAADIKSELARRTDVALIECSGCDAPLRVAQIMVNQIEKLASVNLYSSQEILRDSSMRGSSRNPPSSFVISQ